MVARYLNNDKKETQRSSVTEHHSACCSVALYYRPLLIPIMRIFIFFLWLNAGGSDPSTDFHTKWLNRRGLAQGRVFCSENRNYCTPRSPNTENWANFCAS